MKGGLCSTGRSIGTRRLLRSIFDTSRDDGFTIIEVLVVLAVTGALFVSAALAIAGRQNQTAFDQAIRQVQSQIQQAINEVSVGYIPDKGSYRCTAGAAGPVLSTGGAGQGTKSGCVFLGKVMQFKLGVDPETFVTYTVTGLQNGAPGGTDSVNLAQAKPVVVTPSTSHSGANYPDSSVRSSLQNGLTAARVWYNNGGADIEVGAVAFVSSLDEYSSSGGAIAGKIDVIPVINTILGASQQITAEAINSDGGNNLITSTPNPSGGVFVCFSSGGTDQYGVIKIGGSGRELAVTLTIKNKNNTTCS